LKTGNCSLDWEARRLLPIVRRIVDREAPVILMYRGKVAASEEDDIFPKIRRFYSSIGRRGLSREFFTEVYGISAFYIQYSPVNSLFYC
jgi:hypothetical protein